MIKINLSASSIAAFKACKVRFRNVYHYGIRPIEETESQRIGDNWHKILDVGSQVSPDKDPTDIVVEELNRIYVGIDFADPEAKEIERLTLLYVWIGYYWKYGNKQDQVLAREIRFELPLLNPYTGRAVPGVILQGRIDKIIRLSDGRLAIKEHKSTSNSIDPDSTYWGHLNLDTQTSLYLYVAKRLQLNGELDIHGIFEHDPPINTIMYDVYHKPQISPKKLTQTESKKFVEDGNYCEQKFEIKYDDLGMTGLQDRLVVNNTVAVTEPGAKEGTFAIRETPEMFAARFLQDITERPDFYFRCVELSRTDDEMKRFEQQLFNICRDMQYMIKSGQWYCNEQQCEAKFRCEYLNVCYNNQPIDPDHIPDGFKLIFNKENKNDNTGVATT